MSRSIAAVFAALPVLLACAGAFAGTTATMKTQRGQSILLMDGNKLRTEEPSRESVGAEMIYDGDAQTMIMIDGKEKTYSVMTPAKLKAQMAEVGVEMKKSMANMSPEQRAQMQGMMEKMDPEARKRMESMMNGGSMQAATKPAKLQFEKTGQQKTVAGFSCEGFRQLNEGKVVAQGCFIPWSAAGVPKSDLGSMQKMTEFVREGGMGAVEGSALSQMANLPGFPGEWGKVARDGSVSNQMTLTSIKQGSISADQFKAPAGYTEKDLIKASHH